MKIGPLYCETFPAQPQPESTVLVDLRWVPATGTVTSAEHLEVRSPQQLTAAILERYPLRADQNILMGLHFGSTGLKLSVHAYRELGLSSDGLVLFLSGLAPGAEARFFHDVMRGLTFALLQQPEGEEADVQS